MTGGKTSNVFTYTWTNMALKQLRLITLVAPRAIIISPAGGVAGGQRAARRKDISPFLPHFEKARSPRGPKASPHPSRKKHTPGFVAKNPSAAPACRYLFINSHNIIPCLTYLFL